MKHKTDKNIGNFPVRSVLKSDDQPGTFKCARKRCNTRPFIHNADKITGPKRTLYQDLKRKVGFGSLVNLVQSILDF